MVKQMWQCLSGMLGRLRKAPSTDNGEKIAMGCNDLFSTPADRPYKHSVQVRQGSPWWHASTVCSTLQACLGGIGAVALLEEHHFPACLPGILQPCAAVQGLASNQRQRRICRRQALHHVQGIDTSGTVWVVMVVHSHIRVLM